METDAVLALLQDVAARVIDPRFRALASGEVSEKRPGDLVTVADHEAEVLITRALLADSPGAVVLGEEAYAGDASLWQRWAAAEHGFTVDPVDGTKNFVHGSPDHAVMVSEQRAGVTVRAWIWQPQHQRAYVAERGAGAWRDGERLVRPVTSPDPARWRGVTSARSWLGRALDGLRPLELTWVCCGVDYPRLVEGDADFVLYRGTQPWDHAPGGLLLAESGAFLGDPDGAPYSPRARPRALIGAADEATYDEVRRRLSATDWLRPRG